ncbi:APC family permease [Nocardioides sp. Kera G14]|uniref:APC family permease n=1 Tax=Nocardioides sp. Kera G14 TaxID=2884264 RepID=UPI001D0FC646|nr:APC family permease [Nocardioides sp. Kera G14]UDY25002.1 APC family permease [Nocardioides sp. Kera G14]
MNTRTELDRQGAAEHEDHKLRRELGFWSLTAAGVGSVIGSGWLFSAMYASQVAGPAALIAWVIAGALMLMIALVFAELGMVRPESGGLVRYPLYSNGRLAASIIGWAMWLAYVTNPPSEASAVVQYASTWWDGVYDSSSGDLTTLGTVVAVLLMAAFVVINYFGVKWFARANDAVTTVKLAIPVITVLLLLASGFGANEKAGGISHNISAQGFAPYGISAAFSAIASGGLIFAYTGFRNVIELSGEARNPHRDIPRAMIVTIGFSIVLYLGLQVGYLAGLPAAELAKTGWHGINLDSPFADLAKLLGFTWLSWLLIADSSISPSGAGIVYTAANARNVFGLAKNGFFPGIVMRVSDRTGVPVAALFVNFVLGAGTIVLLPSWHSIVEVLSALTALTFSIGSVSLLVFRRVGLGDAASRLRGMELVAPAAFVVSSLVILWQDWDTLWKTIIPLLVGLVWFSISFVRGERNPGDLAGGIWLVVYIAFIYVVAAVGNFGGTGWLPQPWDSVVVAVGSLGSYLWGVRAGTQYLTGHPRLLERLRTNSGEMIDDGPTPVGL